MTCVWKGLLQALSPEFKSEHHLSNERSLVNFCKQMVKSNGKKAFMRSGEVAVHHQGIPVTEKQVSEAIEWILSYNVNGIQGGHLTSSCDPFLLLLTAYCDCSMEHKLYGGHTVVYENPFNHSRLWLKFASDKGHFWFVGRETKG